MPTPVNTFVDISGPSLPAASQPSLPMPAASQLPSDDQTAATAAVTSPAAAEQLQSQLDDSLKNSGIKAEIENKSPGLVIVRFVQAETGQVVFQMPPQGILDMLAQFDKQAPTSPLAGNNVDTSV